MGHEKSVIAVYCDKSYMDVVFLTLLLLSLQISYTIFSLLFLLIICHMHCDILLDYYIRLLNHKSCDPTSVDQITGTATK
jgi:hypothetical protein